MIVIVLQAGALLTAVIIFFRAESMLARMSRCTPLWVRSAVFLLAVGALWTGVTVLMGAVPSVASNLMGIGVALLLVFDRRQRPRA